MLRRGLTLKTLQRHGPCAGVNLANTEDTEFIGIFRKAFAYAQRCKAEFVVVHTNEEWTGQRAVIQELVFERLKMLAALAADYKVRILVENVGLKPKGTLLFDWEDYQKLLKKLPRTRALLDTGHDRKTEPGKSTIAFSGPRTLYYKS